MKHRNGLIALITAVLLLAAAFLAGCAEAEDTPPAADEPAPQVSGETRSIGTGGNSFVLKITESSGETITWNIHTDKATVGAALLENDLIEGIVNDFGLLVTHVNGERADFNEDGAYWAFYIDDEFATVGVDAADIEEGKVYALVYTKA